MNRTDALVAAIGAGVLVVALIGAALTGTGGGGGTFAVTWTTESAEHDLGDAQIQGSGETQFTFENPHANLTALHVTVTVSAGAPHIAPQGDPIRVTVTSPDGTEYLGEGTLGVGPGSVSVSVAADVQTAPAVTTASGATPGAATANLATEHTNATGVGTWTILVQLTHGSPSPEGHTVAASVEPHWYAAQVAPDVPTAR